MRHGRILGSLILILSVAGVWAADEPKPPEGQPPTVVLARALPGDKEGVTLQIRTPNIVTQAVLESVKVPYTVEVIVDGKVRTETRERAVQRTRTVQRAMGWRTVRVPVDGEAVFVTDLKGKTVAAGGLAKLLDEETPVLLSTSGKVDPFYLKTTKAGTLIVVMPPDRLYSAAAKERPATTPVPLPPPLPPPPIKDK
jgi:hypothetical protein